MSDFSEDELDELLDEDQPEDETPTKRKRGRPKGSRKSVNVGGEGQEEELTADGIALPLFSSGVGRHVAYIRVTRTEPNEGTLGNMEDPHATLSDISNRYGGGTFRLAAISMRHKILRTETVKIAGDPIFQSRQAEAMWKRSMGIKDLPATTTPNSLDMKEILVFMSEKEAMRQAAESQLQERVARIQMEADERRRKDDDERERRRRLDEEDRERRQAIARQQDDDRQRQNTATMLAMMQAGHTQTLQFMQAQLAASKTTENSGGMMEAFKTIALVKDTFGGGGGGEAEETSMNLLLKHGASWLSAAGSAIGGAAREIRGNPAPATPAQQQAQGILASLPAPISAKAETLVMKLLEKGRDPEVELDRILGNVITAVDKLPSANSTPRPHLEPPVVRTPQPQTLEQVSSDELADLRSNITPIRKPPQRIRTQVVVATPHNDTVSISFKRNVMPPI